MSKRILRWIALYLAASVLLLSTSGCGFHLRGLVQLPPEMAVTYIQGDGTSVMMQELRRSLESSGARLTEQPDKTAAVLEIVRAERDRRVLSVGTSARVQEYELSYTVEFSVYRADGSELVPVQTVQLRRAYQFDETDVLGKSGEEELLRREMEREVAHSLLRRLRVGK